MIYNSLFLDSIDSIDNSWNDFLSLEVVTLLKNIEENILECKQEFTPNTDKVLKFLKVPLADVKVIIL
jgi:uracil DNA glycosylase